jgi:hypothetical protein
MGFDIARDFPGAEGGEDQFRSAVEDLVGTFAENRSSLDRLIKTVKGLPRMTTEFNRAKKRLAAIQSELREEIDRFVTSLEAALQKWRRDRVLSS